MEVVRGTEGVHPAHLGLHREPISWLVAVLYIGAFPHRRRSHPHLSLCSGRRMVSITTVGSSSVMPLCVCETAKPKSWESWLRRGRPLGTEV